MMHRLLLMTASTKWNALDLESLNASDSSDSDHCLTLVLWPDRIGNIETHTGKGMDGLGDEGYSHRLTRSGSSHAQNGQLRNISSQLYALYISFSFFQLGHLFRYSKCSSFSFLANIDATKSQSSFRGFPVNGKSVSPF